jgi:hypothetical protein
MDGLREEPVATSASRAEMEAALAADAAVV